MLPDRRGTDRIGPLRDIVRDPRAALPVLVPGSGTTFRVDGRAAVSSEPDLLASLAAQGHRPRTAVVLAVGEACFRCSRAIVRSGLSDAGRHGDPRGLPTPGEILAAPSDERNCGRAYGEARPGRARATLW